jgi:Protein of unknown function (DUF775)
VDEFKFIFVLEDATNINHIVVFLLPESKSLRYIELIHSNITA